MAAQAVTSRPADHTPTTSVNPRSLAGRRLYIPRMTYSGARLLAAAFRSLGIDATLSPESDARTLELGGQYSSGEECLPHKITLGDFLKVIESPDFDPAKTAFFMPTADGPCRFGQYAPYLRSILDDRGCQEVMVVSPTSENSYEGLGEQAGELMRTAWQAIVCADLVRKLLLKTRPYERRTGDADALYEQALGRLETIVQQPGLPPKERLRLLAAALVEIRDRFRAMPADRREERPLIGVVGEIFCRLNRFSNEDALRKIEQHGGECWISDTTEWVWYTNWGQELAARRMHGRLSLAWLKTKIKSHVQHSDEKALLAPFAQDLRGYEEPHDIREVLEAAEPYLPPQGALGEMVLSIGKTIYLYRQGADAIVDISPFTCMNGIVSEAVYPAVSRDHDGIPIRNFYFDGVPSSLNRDLGIFMELARSYQRRKRIPRRRSPQ